MIIGFERPKTNPGKSDNRHKGLQAQLCKPPDSETKPDFFSFWRIFEWRVCHYFLESVSNEKRYLGGPLLADFGPEETEYQLAETKISHISTIRRGGWPPRRLLPEGLRIGESLSGLRAAQAFFSDNQTWAARLCTK